MVWYSTNLPVEGYEGDGEEDAGEVEQQAPPYRRPEPVEWVHNLQRRRGGGREEEQRKRKISKG